MAIIFNRNLSEDGIYLAYNNNIIEFYSDSGFTIANAVITIDTQSVILYPSPSGIFTYNFKDIITTLLNSDNFKDDLQTDLDASNVYDWSDKVYLRTDILVTINFTNDTAESSEDGSYRWLSGYINLRDWKLNNPSLNLDAGIVFLLQKQLFDYYKYKLKYWSGFPFDITIYNNGTSFNVRNENNSIDYDFTSLFDVTRLVFSDGRTDVSIEDLIPLQTGLNNLNFNEDFNLELNKVVDNCTEGTYIKWINSLGGWNYWYFPKAKEETKTKSKGFLQNDYNNLVDTISPLVSLGKESQNILRLQEKKVSEDYKLLLTDLLDSAKVYLFTGVPFAKNTFNDWVEVDLLEGSFQTSNSRGVSYTFNLSLELPPNITRSL